MIFKEENERAVQIGNEYKRLFKDRFGAEPAPFDYPDGEVIAFLAKNYSVEKVTDLLYGYFSLDDDWIKKQGYPLSLFKKSLNAVVVAASDGKGSLKRVYTCALTSTGRPMQSNHPKDALHIPRNPLGKIGIEIHPSFYDKPVRPWMINDQWFGDKYLPFVKGCAKELGMLLDEYIAKCKDHTHPAEDLFPPPDRVTPEEIAETVKEYF